ncbi:MAG: hypothetical protein JKX79_00115 [Labilibaculum sp.]|nr:hypothetical protein [Labilibaculum sp.]
MKKRLLSVLCVVLALGIAKQVYSQERKDSKKSEVQILTTDSIASKKVEKNRNIMLNAETNSGPRNVNIGLPFKGDMIILENNVPVVYYYYPTMPLYSWRKDNSLSRMGLLSFAEGALTLGKVGLAVQSFDRKASSKFKGYATIYGNNFGSTRFDATITGPIGKKGWGYMFSMYQNFSHGNGTNYMFTQWNDKTSMVKGAIQKDYNKGFVRVIYKMVDSKMYLMNYKPLRYLGDGKTESLPNFDLGKDSYILGNGMLPYYDPRTGEAAFADWDDDENSRSISHNIYLNGEHKFNNGWKLTYTSMYQAMKNPFPVSFPLSIGITEFDQRGPADKYYYHGTKNAYEGAVQMTINNNVPQSDNRSVLSRTELTKKVKEHNLRLGLTHFYNKRKYVKYGGMYMHTVEANPQLLDRYYVAAPGMEINITPNGLMSPKAGGYGNVYNDSYNKLALYVSDDFSLTSWIDLSLGARIEHQNKHEVHDASASNQISSQDLLITKDFKNDWNKVAVASTTVKLTKNFGLIGEFTYNSWVDSYWDYKFRDPNNNPIDENGLTSSAGGYPNSTLPEKFEQKVVNYGGGIFLNLGAKFSMVSKVTSISKEKNRYTNAKVTNPVDPTETADFSPVFYDIKTLGWTTDIVTNPIKNFNLHFLITLQKPEYRNFAFGAFGVNYNYEGKIIPELSQTLIEIDPSYSFMGGKMRAWFSLRYFGKQYGNPTNAFTYNSRWENFGGLDYRMSRNVKLKLQVVNFLDQKGVKGAVQGADQVLSDADYIGRPLVAGGIRPRTVELSVDFKF